MTTSAIQHKARYSGFGRDFTIALLGLTLGCKLCHAQEPLNRDSATLVSEKGSVLLKIDSGRPIARAVMVLEARYGYVITYEDPRYTNQDDVVDVAPTVRKNYSTSRPAKEQELLVPRAGQLTLRLPNASSISADDLDKLLHELIRVQGASSHGGHFRILRDGDVFHVVPAEVRDHDGNWAPHSSLLDTPISLPEQDRSERGLYDAIAAAVSSTAHVSMSVVVDSGGIVMGGTPVQRPRTKTGAINEPARNVLMHALQASPVKRTWLLGHALETGPNAFSLNIFELPTPSEVLY